MRPHGPNCWNGLGALSDLVRLEKNGEKTLKINHFMYVFKNFKNTTILFYSNDLDLESAISPASANFLTNNLSSTSLICNIFMIQFFSRNILSFLFFFRETKLGICSFLIERQSPTAWLFIVYHVTWVQGCLSFLWKKICWILFFPDVEMRRMNYIFMCWQLIYSIIKFQF